MNLVMSRKQRLLVGVFTLLASFNMIAQVSFAAKTIPKTQAENLTNLIEDGWVEDARDQLLSLVDQYPDDAFVRYELARSSLWLKDFDRADKQSRKCIDLVSDNVEYQILRGHVLGSMAQRGSKIKALSRAKGCRKAYEAAVKLDPDSVVAREALMMYHMMAPGFAGGKKKVARQQAEAINSIDPMHGNFARAQILQHLDKDSAGARGEYQAAIVNFGSDSAPCYEYAGFLKQQKEINEAIRYYEMGISKDDSPVGPLLNLGQLFSADDRPEQAIDAFERVLIIDPTEIEASIHLSQVYFKTKKYGKSEAILTKVLADNPNAVYALYQEGVLLSKRGKNLQKAEANFRKYLDSRLNMGWKSRSTAIYHLAKVKEKQGKFTEAWELAKSASKLEPYNKFLKKEAKRMEFMGSED